MNWIVDAGTVSSPVVKITKKDLEVNEDYTDDLIVDEMSEKFCNFKDDNFFGIIFVTHLDQDHYNLIPAILLNCTIKYYDLMLNKDPEAFLSFFNKVLLKLT